MRERAARGGGGDRRMWGRQEDAGIWATDSSPGRVCFRPHGLCRAPLKRAAPRASDPWLSTHDAKISLSDCVLRAPMPAEEGERNRLVRGEPMFSAVRAFWAGKRAGEWGAGGCVTVGGVVSAEGRVQISKITNRQQRSNSREMPRAHQAVSRRAAGGSDPRHSPQQS